VFHVPLSHVTFEQVERFCREFPEGVRVEYKQEPTNKIPKVISSFANTMGGIWVIGVRTDRANRARLPITGMAGRGGIEEQIVQSAQTSIYPAITPDVRVLNVPNEADRIVAIVKVHESFEAPHAVDSSTRVYVRVASTTQPYELADIDRIEYLLKRRQEPERRREELITQAAGRSPYKSATNRVRVIVSPVYPRGIVVPYESLYERAENLQYRNMLYLKRFRRIHEGITSSQLIARDLDYHFEVSIYGITFFEEPVDTTQTLEVLGTRERVPYLYPVDLLKPLARVLNHAIPLLQETVTNVMIRYELFGLQRVGFRPEFAGRRLTDPQLAVGQYRCVDPHIAVSTRSIIETLGDRRVQVISEIMEQVLWAFDYSNADLENLIGQTLREASLV